MDELAAAEFLIDKNAGHQDHAEFFDSMSD